MLYTCIVRRKRKTNQTFWQKPQARSNRAVTGFSAIKKRRNAQNAALVPVFFPPSDEYESRRRSAARSELACAAYGSAEYARSRLNDISLRGRRDIDARGGRFRVHNVRRANRIIVIIANRVGKR